MFCALFSLFSFLTLPCLIGFLTIPSLPSSFPLPFFLSRSRSLSRSLLSLLSFCSFPFLLAHLRHCCSHSLFFCLLSSFSAFLLLFSQFSSHLHWCHPTVRPTAVVADSQHYACTRHSWKGDSPVKRGGDSKESELLIKT